MADAISRFLFERLDIRGVVVQLGSSWRDMLAGRGYPDAVRDLLGQLAAVTAVIGGNLKSENRMSFQLQGGGPELPGVNAHWVIAAVTCLGMGLFGGLDVGADTSIPQHIHTHGENSANHFIRGGGVRRQIQHLADLGR